jgi:hypothetical protein
MLEKYENVFKIIFCKMKKNATSSHLYMFKF